MELNGELVHWSFGVIAKFRQSFEWASASGNTCLWLVSEESLAVEFSIKYQTLDVRVEAPMCLSGTLQYTISSASPQSLRADVKYGFALLCVNTNLLQKYHKG